MYYDAEKIGERIQELRKENNITQENLAYKLGVTAHHLGRIEKGKKGTSVDLLMDVSEYFDISTDYLLFGRKNNSDEIKESIRSVIKQLDNIQKMVS